MKTYIKINLNKAESSEVLKERVLERTRWVVFGILIFIRVMIMKHNRECYEFSISYSLFHFFRL